MTPQQRKCFNLSLFAISLCFVYHLPITSSIKQQDPFEQDEIIISNNYSSYANNTSSSKSPPRRRSCYKTVQDALKKVDSSRGVIVLSVGNGMETFVPHWVVNAHRYGFLQSSIINAQTKAARRYMENVPLKHEVTCYSRTNALDIESGGGGGGYGSRKYVTLISDR
eukprot:PhF_6_TR25956/c0_g1_i1/m.36618